MRLKKPAEHAMTTPFEVMDSNGDFVPGFTGRLAPIDRFLSNFHRPLQRRMLFSPADYTLPDSGVIRNTVTGVVYLIGQTRHDDEHDETYVQLSVAHMVVNHSSGIATLERYVVDNARPEATIGELVKTTVATPYISVEYKTSIENFGSDEEFEDRFLIFAPISVQFADEDILTLNGKQYVINSPYIDSDLSSAIATREVDDRETGTYRVTTLAYDPAAGVAVRSYDDYLVTCTVRSLKDGRAKSVNAIETDVLVYLKSPSFTKTPLLGDRFMVRGVTYVIMGAEQAKDHDYDWRLECERVVV